MRQKMAVRHAERERIARELHDTLLQGISGLLMRVQVWSGRRELPADLQGDMQRASDQGRTMLSQGRDRIAELRADDSELVHLADAIRAIGERLSSLHASRFIFVNHAADVTLRHDVGEDVLAIVHEATANAYAHAGGESVTVLLEERADRISISVTDDGCGITTEQLDEAGTTGHWGLVGMRERARRIGVRLSIGAGDTGGTRVLIEGIRPASFPESNGFSRRR
jgi:signal transduction histidine kinase